MNCGVGKMQLPACCANRPARASQERLSNALLVFAWCPWTSRRFLIQKTTSLSQTSIPLHNGVVGSLVLNLHALTETYAEHVWRISTLRATKCSPLSAEPSPWLLVIQGHGACATIDTNINKTRHWTARSFPLHSKFPYTKFSFFFTPFSDILYYDFLYYRVFSC
jgi:hypothetical protein